MADERTDPEEVLQLNTNDKLGRILDVFRGAGEIFDGGQTFLARFRLDIYASRRQQNLYYPFASLGDWEIANFLLTSRLSMRAIDEFLSLRLTNSLPLSFSTTKELRSRAEILPSGPRWNARVVPTTHPTKSPVTLYYRDSLDCVESLFNHPLFAQTMDYSPFRLFTTAERIVRVFTEWMSSDGAWDLQLKFPEGSTLCGVILSSDKTHITNMCGGKVAHPLLISLANIRMDIRNKGSSHAFLLLALMPIPAFTHPATRICSVLEARLFHHCLDIVLEPLKQAARFGRMMSDPVGNLPALTLAQLQSIQCNVNEVERYFAACEDFRLSGVSHPFWRDWLYADPSQFLTPEALHHWHRQFWDHDMQWCKHALGAGELDFRFSVLPPIASFRHFNQGVTKLKQVGGRTQRDAQRYIVVVIAGFPQVDVVIAVRALMEFRYLAQAPAITSQMHDRISAALKTFHDHKHAIIDAGLRRGQTTGAALDHWEIPKLEFMQSVAPSIHQAGAVIQWSADTTEHAHIEVVKDPVTTTNNQNYDSQICRTLDRDEKCRLFSTAVSLSERTDTHNSLAGDDSETDVLDHSDPNMADSAGDDAIGNILQDLWSSDRSPICFFDSAEKLSNAPLGSVPRPLRTLAIGRTALRLNYKPSIRRISIDDAADTFSLPDLRGALSDYLNREGSFCQNFHSFGHQRRSSPNSPLPFNDLHIWFKVRVQQRTYFDSTKFSSAFTINAHPPDRHWKFGRYDAAILNTNPQYKWPLSGLAGHNVVLIRLIMSPLSPRGTTIPWADRALVYAERLDLVQQAHGLVDHATGLHVLQRAVRASGTPLGEVFPLDQIRSYTHITPRFGAAADNRLSSANSIHFAQSFFLNKYFDKDFFYAIT
ncbi:hypothetical protein EDD15DRAFT_2172157 [Pisolithus albus]|nr:hypothetical protein EDD15DRAFT_2172157 [Pisolithus albus]